jgi:hypothetical protein
MLPIVFSERFRKTGPTDTDTQAKNKAFTPPTVVFPYQPDKRVFAFFIDETAFLISESADIIEGIEYQKSGN